MDSIEELNQQLDMGLDVYRHYISSDVRLKRKIRSPFRNESNPSFCLFRHKEAGTIWHTDFAYETPGDHWKFVMRLFGISFADAIKKVKSEIMHGIVTLEEQSIRIYEATKYREKNDKVLFEPVRRKFNQFDLAWWARFGVSEKTLERFNVYPVSSYTSIYGNDRRIIRSIDSDPIYFIEFPSGRHKIYRPLTLNVKYKWRSNTDSLEDIFGFDLLRGTEKLFICAGQKDTMAFNELTGMDAIALNSETASLDMELFMMLNGMYEGNIYSIMDNDETGRKASERLYLENGIIPANDIIIDYEVNDFGALMEGLIYHKRPDLIKEVRSYYTTL